MWSDWAVVDSLNITLGSATSRDVDAFLRVSLFAYIFAFIFCHFDFFLLFLSFSFEVLSFKFLLLFCFFSLAVVLRLLFERFG